MRIEQLAREAAEQTKMLTAVLDVSRELTSTLELGHLLQVILDQLGTIVDYGSATLFLLEQDEVVVLGSRSRSAQPTPLPQRMRLADVPKVAQVVAQRAPLVIARI